MLLAHPIPSSLLLCEFTDDRRAPALLTTDDLALLSRPSKFKGIVLSDQVGPANSADSV